MAEAEFKKNVNNKLKELLHNQTTFTPYRRGTPDHWYSGKVRDLWVEYKYLKHAPRNGITWESLLEPLQYDWCTGRKAEGRDVWVITGFKSNSEGMILRGPTVKIQKATYSSRLLSVSQISTIIENFCNG